MKNKLAKISLATIALLIVAASQMSLLAQNRESGLDQSANRLVGAWETTVTPRDCETGEPSPTALPFNGLITFNEGGTVAEYGANPTTPFRTPGHGIWASTGGGSNYLMRFSFMPLTPAGVPIGRLRVSQDLVLSRFSDESHSTGSFVLTSFSGMVLATGCTSATAVRLQF